MGKKNAQKQQVPLKPVSPSDVPLPESPVPGGMQVTSVPPDMLATLLQEMRQDRLEAQRRLDEERQEASRRFDQLLATLAPQVNVNNDSSHPNDTTSSPSSSSRPTLPKATVQPPPVLQHDATLRQFREWKQLWDDYTVMVELDKLSQPKQLVQLRSALSSEMRRTLEVSLEVLPSSTLSVNDVIARLRDHVRSQKNEALRRLAFSQCKQAEGEKFNDFYIRLKQAAEEVDLCKGNDANCLETQIKHAVLIGVRDEEVKQRLLELKSDATLDQVITVCRSREAAEVTTQELRPSQPTARAVSAYKKQKHPKKHRNANGKKTEPQVNKNRSERQVNDRCGRCGYTHPMDKCPAIGEECRKCSKVGHFASCCMSKDTTKTTTGNRGNAMAVTGATQCNVRATTAQFPSVVGTPSPTIELRVCAGVKSGNVTCVPDTGADTTLMTRDLLKVLCMETSDLKRLENFGIGNPDGTSFASDMLGSVFIAMSYGNKTINGWVTVMESLPRSLLSYDHTKGLGMIPADFPRPIENGSVRNASVSRSSSRQLPSSHTPPAEVKKFFMEEFPDVLMTKEDFHDGAALKEMSGPPMRIHVKKDAVPFAIYTPRVIPLAWQNDVKNELEAMVKQGIITPVSGPSEWCHPLVTVAKPKGGVRLTVDLSNINGQTIRPAHPSPTPHTAVRQVNPRARYFTTMDALYGYWQMKLAEEDQYLTTFITPYGRFRFCRGPMGFVATGDEFCRRGDVALSGVQQCVKVVDDILLWDEHFDAHLERVYEVLVRCRTHGITINADKFVLAASEVSFCGYGISGEGIAADDTKVRAITEFPKPANITDVRSFMGLVNQLGDFSPHIAETAEPLRALMSPRRAFTWTPDHDVAFERVKKALSRPPVLAHFDPSLKVVLQTDASRLYGVGYALLQEHQDGTLRLIQCGSRFLADEESRYSTIELEMVAAVWGMVKCKYYLLGLPHFTIVIDHRPLVPILNTYTLDAIENPRLQRLKEKIAGYVYTSVWRKGRDHVLPDALSRAPVDQPTQEDIALSTETRTHVRGVVTQRAGDMTLDELRVDAREDPTYTKLLGYVTKGFPADRNDIEPELLPYWKQRDDMYHDGELVLIGPRVVVPSAQRRKVLARLHDAHCGIEATKRRARQTVWWPGINSDITSTVKACSPCQTLHPSQQQEPLVTEEAPELPFESVSADFFSTAGKSFLVYVDRLSGWPVVAQCGSDTTTTATIAFFRKFFRDLGVPVRLRSDGGPQFASREFADFLHRWGVRHEMSSPHYPQSNGHAEAAVKAVKYLIMKVAPTGTLNEDFDRGLLELRNTPRQDGRSPAQVLYGRPLRSLIPAHSASFASKWQAKTEVCERRAAARSMDVRLRYDSHAKPLPPLRLGDQVRIQDPTTKRWDKVATVMGVGKSRDYLVRTMSGRVLWRNRRFLLKIPAPTDIPKGEEPPDEGSPKLPATPGRRQRRPKDNVPLRRSQRIARRGGGGDVG